MQTKEIQSTQFGLCLSNEGYAASLETGKLYQVIPDIDAEEQGYLRVIDESGEDYAYETQRFYQHFATRHRCFSSVM